MNTDRRMALDWHLVHVLNTADADLNAQQQESLARAARVLERDQPLNLELRLELEKIRELLPELLAND